MLTTPADPRQLGGRTPRLAPLYGDRQPATGAVRRPVRGHHDHKVSRGFAAALTLLTAIVVPTYAVSTGRARWAERLVPREEALRLSEYLGQASPQTMILLFVGTFAFLLMVWAAVCAATYTLGTLVDRARHQAR